MLVEEIEQLLQDGIPDAVFKITGEGENFSVDVISAAFENTSRLNRQKKVLSCVKEQIAAGQIHAFSVQTFTQEEWDRNINSLTVL